MGKNIYIKSSGSVMVLNTQNVFLACYEEFQKTDIIPPHCAYKKH